MTLRVSFPPGYKKPKRWRLIVAGVWMFTAGINLMLALFSTLIASSWGFFNALCAVACIVCYSHNMRLYNEGE